MRRVPEDMPVVELAEAIETKRSNGGRSTSIYFPELLTMVGVANPVPVLTDT
jgi:hypothetical protein